MQITLVQLDIQWEDKPANYDRVRSLLAVSAIRPGALVALPEMFATGFSMHVSTIAEPRDGPTYGFLASLAKEFQCAVMGGVVTRTADGRGRNEAIVCGPDGELARYCKLHPFSFVGETKYYEAGDRIQTFEWQEFTVAPFVCYDLRFPEIFRTATRRGATLLTVIANWPQAREAHWLALLKARAIENQAYVAGVNRSGSDPHVPYSGRSLIVGPKGEILADGGEEQVVVTIEIELGPLLDYRAKFPALADMRSEYFPD